MIETALANAASAVIAFVPQLIAALIVLLIGLVISRWLKTLVVKLIHAINISDLFQHTVLGELSSQKEIRLKIDQFLGAMVQWFIIYIAVVSALNILGLTTVSVLLTGLLNYVPRVIAAVFIFIVGILVAGFVESVVKNAFSSVDVSTGRLMGKVASYTLMVFTSLLVIGELGIAQEYITILFIGFVAMLSLSFGLALGLGAKDLVKDILSHWYKKFSQ